MIRVSNSYDPDQTQRFVQPDLGPYCLQKLLDTIGQNVKPEIFWP